MFIDTHIDTLWAMDKQNRQFSNKSERGHVDLPRAQQADLLAGFFTGYPTESHYITERMLKNWLQFVNKPKNKLIRIKSFNDLEALIKDRNNTGNIQDKHIGAILCLEGAAGIDTELNRLYIYYDLGLRSMGLTWNEMNQFATGQEQKADRGLTQEGIDLISVMEDMGIIIDVSHLNDQSFWDVINNTNTPIIASHSNVREIAEHNRNLTREMVEAIADTNGSIGVNFYKGFLNNNMDNASINDIIKMYDEIISIGGINSVHVGADLDGATLPDGIDDITDVPRVLNMVQESLELSDKEMKAIRTENIKRVIKDIWR